MNLISTWLDFWSKLIDPDTKFNRQCYFCHGGIPPLDIPLYVLIEESENSGKTVPACCYCYKAHEKPVHTFNDFAEAVIANSTPKEVEIAVSTSLTRKLKIK